MTEQSDKTAALRALITDGTLVLPNAWDAGSARVIERAGAQAIATTSGGVSWSLGRRDGHGITRSDQASAVARIVQAVSVPVTADIEGGYGPGTDDVAATVAGIIAAGAVGINLEDSRADGTLFSVEEQATRIAAARAAAVSAGLPSLVINARTDPFLFGIGEPEGRLGDVLQRGSAYAEAGADGLFVPGLADLQVIGDLVARASLPINILAGAGAPSITELAAAGVRRVSVGTAIAEAAYRMAEDAATEILNQGTYTRLGTQSYYSAMNDAFPPISPKL
jgi:2-methylisocitrate lyase-like PEP mutase family enzyme